MDNEKFKIQADMAGAQKKVKLKGIIDEDANFESLKKATGEVVINFREVSSINSLGVRNWVNFLKDFAGGRTVYFEECPPFIVRQMNMVPSFVGGAQVKSLYASYVCDACEFEKLILIDQNTIASHGTNMPMSMTCEKCKKGEMEFDGHPKQYFSFVK